MAAEIQDGATGQWHPYPEWDNGRGNIRIDGITYSHEMGREKLAQQSPTGGDGGDPAPDGGDPSDPSNSPGTDWFWNGTNWEFQGAGASSSGGGGQQPTTGGGYIPYTGGGGGGSYEGGGGGAGYGDTPMFEAPRWQAPPEFVFNRQFAAPNQQELQNDPSFQFRLDQGRKALEQSAAGKGVLRTGGTLKDLVNYGQNFATNEYSNVYNRKFGEYKFDYDKEADIYSKNYGLKRDVFDRNYKASYDEYAPKLRGYEMNFNRDWQRYMYDRDKEQQDMGSWPNG